MPQKLQTKMLIENTNISKKLCLEIKHKKEEKHMLNPLEHHKNTKKQPWITCVTLLDSQHTLEPPKNMKTALLNDFGDLIELLLPLCGHF